MAKPRQINFIIFFTIKWNIKGQQYHTKVDAKNTKVFM